MFSSKTAIVLIIVAFIVIVDCKINKGGAKVDSNIHHHPEKPMKRQGSGGNVVETSRHVHVVHDKQQMHGHHSAGQSDEHVIDDTTTTTTTYRKVPKLLKMTTKFEQCKLECKRQQEEEDAQQYVERLRFELAAAELALEQHVEQLRQQLHQYEEAHQSMATVQSHHHESSSVNDHHQHAASDHHPEH